MLARMEDVFRCADAKSVPGFTGFLDERQQEMARQLAARQAFGNFLLYGGYDGAARRMLGAFPDYMDASGDPAPLFEPLLALTFRFRSEDVLTHRDFLGAFMNLGIKRETLGDILVGDGLAVIFLTQPVAALAMDELKKVGRVGVRCECGVPEVLPVEEHFEELRDTVSSMRLDCVVCALVNCSREKAAQFIRQGLVTHNYKVSDRASDSVEPGDKISVRGYGKFLVAQTGGLTKKGRIQLLCKKYL